MTTSKKIQDHLREHGKMHYRKCAKDLGLTPKDVSSRIHGMSSRNTIVIHGGGFISAGDVTCLPKGHNGGGSRGPYRRKVLELSDDDRYVLRQISFEPRTRDVLLELYGEDEAAHLQRVIGRLLRRLWIFLRLGEYEITEMGRRALAYIDEDDAKQEAERKKAERGKEAKHKPAVVPHLRETKAGRKRCPSASRLGESLH